MVDIWIREVQNDYDFERKHTDLLKKINEIKQAITTSSMRFKRKDKYILTDDVYKLKVLDLNSVKKYLSVAKDFVDKSEEIIRGEDTRQSVLRKDE